MGVRVREERVIMGLLASVAVLLAVLALLVVRGERNREGLEVEYRAERIAAVLSDAYRDGSLEALRAVEGVLGFGLYGPSGESLARLGTAPPTLARPWPLDTAARFVRDPVRRSITLVRPVGMAGLRGMGAHRGMSAAPPSMPRAGGAAFLYLELSDPAYWEAEARLRLAAIAAPATIVIMAALAVYLYLKNAEYRRRMAAREELARLGEVARTLAHEIKNPLGAIRLQTGIIRKTLPGAVERELGLIEEEVDRLALLSDRVGTFLRDPKGQPQAVPVGPFVQAMLARFAGRLAYRADPAAEEASILFDPDRLRSVLENLIANALDSGASEPPEVLVSLRQSRVEIAVLDSGTGIAPEDRERVFDPFFSRKTKGFGVGLAIARRFAEAAGAELRLDPRPEGGTAARLLAPKVAP